MKLFLITLLLPIFAQAGNVNYLSYASTNVTTSAYVTLVASSPIDTGHLEVCDSSGKVLKLAIGPANSEVDIAAVPISGCIIINTFIPAGKRLSIKALDATASTGYNTVSFIQ